MITKKYYTNFYNLSDKSISKIRALNILELDNIDLALAYQPRKTKASYFIAVYKPTNTAVNISSMENTPTIDIFITRILQHFQSLCAFENETIIRLKDQKII